jgi:hypothetical protein
MGIKNTISELSNNNQGSIALLMAMIVLTSVLTIVLTASEIIRNGLVADRTQLGSTKAYFTAETAAERILWETRKKTPQFDVALSCSTGDCLHFGSNSAPGVSCNSACNTNNAITDALSDYKYNIKYGSLITGDTKLICYGDYLGVQRAIEIIY